MSARRPESIRCAEEKHHGVKRGHCIIISLIWTHSRLTVHAPCLSTCHMDLNVPYVPKNLQVENLFCHWSESMGETPCSNLKHNRQGSGSLDTVLQFQRSIHPLVHQVLGICSLGRAAGRSDRLSPDTLQLGAC
jgi:hypothetical protein